MSKISDLGLTYQQYLQTEHWKNFRALFLQKNRQCIVCFSREGLLPHHVTYRVGYQSILFNEIPRYMRCLCQRCHSKIHYYQIEEKVLVNPVPKEVSDYIQGLADAPRDFDPRPITAVWESTTRDRAIKKAVRAARADNHAKLREVLKAMEVKYGHVKINHVTPNYYVIDGLLHLYMVKIHYKSQITGKSGMFNDFEDILEKHMNLRKGYAPPVKIDPPKAWGKKNAKKARIAKRKRQRRTPENVRPKEPTKFIIRKKNGAIIKGSYKPASSI